MRTFWAKGYEATSIVDLTKAMGIGSPSLYQAFGSKEALYAEALRHYGETIEPLYWDRFRSAATAREATSAYLLDSAAAVTACREGAPRGCMVALSSVGSEGYVQLGELVRSERAVALERLEARYARGVCDGEIPASVDPHALARFVQAVQSGMSILARDGAQRAELEDVARLAMEGWSVRLQAKPIRQSTAQTAVK